MHADELVEPALLGGLGTLEDQALVGDEELADVDGRWRRYSGHAVPPHCTDAVAHAASTNGANRNRNPLRTANEVGANLAFLDEAGVLHVSNQRLVLLGDEFRLVSPGPQGGREIDKVLGLIALGLPVTHSLLHRMSLLRLGRRRGLCCLVGTKLLEHSFSLQFSNPTLGLVRSCFGQNDDVRSDSRERV